VAIYHLHSQVISRGKGRSSVAAAAYRAGTKLTDERTGITHDYSRRKGVVATTILAPDDAPDWVHNRYQLWNRVEAAEKRIDARTAREIDVAIPTELNPQQQQQLVEQWAKSTFVADGMVADVAFHDSDTHNPHAHVMLTTRRVDRSGLAAKKERSWNQRDWLLKVRESWSIHANRFLAAAGIKEKIDHRSYADQGIEQIPTIKLGAAATRLEQKGEATERGDINRQIKAANQQIQQQRRQAQKQERTIERLKKKQQPGLIAQTIDTVRTAVAHQQQSAQAKANQKQQDILQHQATTQQALLSVQAAPILSELLKLNQTDTLQLGQYQINQTSDSDSITVHHINPHSSQSSPILAARTQKSQWRGIPVELIDSTQPNLTPTTVSDWQQQLLTQYPQTLATKFFETMKSYGVWRVTTPQARIEYQPHHLSLTIEIANAKGQYNRTGFIAQLDSNSQWQILRNLTVNLDSQGINQLHQILESVIQKQLMVQAARIGVRLLDLNQTSDYTLQLESGTLRLQRSLQYPTTNIIISAKQPHQRQYQTIGTVEYDIRSPLKTTASAKLNQPKSTLLDQNLIEQLDTALTVQRHIQFSQERRSRNKSQTKKTIRDLAQNSLSLIQLGNLNSIELKQYQIRLDPHLNQLDIAVSGKKHLTAQIEANKVKRVYLGQDLDLASTELNQQYQQINREIELGIESIKQQQLRHKLAYALHQTIHNLAKVVDTDSPSFRYKTYEIERQGRWIKRRGETDNLLELNAQSTPILSDSFKQLDPELIEQLRLVTEQLIKYKTKQIKQTKVKTKERDGGFSLE
jgi:hypothetical protein